MSALRSTGWTVKPSFVPGGVTTDVSLLMDDVGLTQLSGDPEVAWQIPWSEVTALELSRTRNSTYLVATIANVRYRWRQRGLGDFEALREVVLTHGGGVERRRRRTGVVVVAVVVLVAALAGGIGAYWNARSKGSNELALARAVNITQKDLPSSFAALSDATVSPMSALFPPSSQVITSTTGVTTTVSATSTWAKVSKLFQTCLGVSPERDRVYGAAGQQPDYQVSSKVYSAANFGGIEVASTTQYYNTTTMVHRDTAEMSHPDFGSCFTTSNVALLNSAYKVALPTENIATNWRPLTFVRGWARGGEAELDLPISNGQLHLVMVVLTSGHFEVTLGSIVAHWPSSRLFLSNLSSTLLARMTSSSAEAV